MIGQSVWNASNALTELNPLNPSKVKSPCRQERLADLVLWANSALVIFGMITYSFKNKKGITLKQDQIASIDDVMNCSMLYDMGRHELSRKYYLDRVIV